MSDMFWLYCEMEAEDINLVSLACGHSPLLVTEPLWWTRPTTCFSSGFPLYIYATFEFFVPKI